MTENTTPRDRVSEDHQKPPKRRRSALEAEVRQLRKLVELKDQAIDQANLTLRQRTKQRDIEGRASLELIGRLRELERRLATRSDQLTEALQQRDEARGELARVRVTTDGGLLARVAELQAALNVANDRILHDRDELEYLQAENKRANELGAEVIKQRARINDLRRFIIEAIRRAANPDSKLSVLLFDDYSND